MKTRWTPRLDAILRAAAKAGDSHADMARAIRRATRGSFAPHRTTCYRRAVQIGALPRPPKSPEPTASTRVDTSSVPARTRAPLGERLPPPPVTVLALPAELVERSSVERVAGVLLSAIPPGWAWEVLETERAHADALASARHQAKLRGDLLELLEWNASGHPVVVLRRAGTGAVDASLSLLVLVVVRFRRAS